MNLCTNPNDFSTSCKEQHPSSPFRKKISNVRILNKLPNIAEAKLPSHFPPGFQVWPDFVALLEPNHVSDLRRCFRSGNIRPRFLCESGRRNYCPSPTGNTMTLFASHPQAHALPGGMRAASNKLIIPLRITASGMHDGKTRARQN